jgi:hypothetical protein
LVSCVDRVGYNCEARRELVSPGFGWITDKSTASSSLNMPSRYHR